ncbi:hypothetical protein CAP35_06625 [Chitinophagaceae bacterium IBVUCB1]|nr:hypothetical protein CAP35_06625 [Chitinophagaceae bacterium IBVUCB1]
MKKTTMPFGTKPFAILVWLFVCIIGMQPNASAVRIAAGALPDVNLFPPGTFSKMNSLNCDMIDIPANGTNPPGKLQAVVYDGLDAFGFPLTGLRVRVFRTGAPTAWTTFALPIGNDARNIDVAIVDDPGATLGQDFYIVVAYENSITNNVEWGFLTATGVGFSPTPWGLLVTGGGFINNTNPARNPHIDAAADILYPVGGGTHYALSDFAIVWEEPHATVIGGSDIGYATFHVAAGITPSPSYTMSMPTHAYEPDVACRGHMIPGATGPTYTLYISYKHVLPSGTSEIRMHEVGADKIGNVWPGPTTIVPPPPGTVSNTYGYPRIEAIVLGDVFPTLTTYNIVSDYLSPTGTVREILNYNDVNGLATYSVNPAVNDFRPVVAGVGRDANAAGLVVFTDKLFVVSHYTEDVLAPHTVGDYSSFSIDLLGGTRTVPVDDYQVNTNDLNIPMPAASESCIAISSSSNNGDGLFTVWFDGSSSPSNGTIKIKTNIFNTNFNYKTTGIENTTAKGYSIYPNPATDVLSLKGANHATYSIVDVTGKTLATGNIHGTGNITVSQLAPGTYILNLQEEGENYKVKFVKQ